MSRGVGALHASSPPWCLQLPAACTVLPVLSLPCQAGGSTTAVGFEVCSWLEEANTTALRSRLTLQPVCAWACMCESTAP